MSTNFRPPSHQSIFVHLALISIPYKMHYSCNVSGMFGILTILSHAHSRIMHFVRNGDKCNMHKIDWCEGGLQLKDIGTKNISETDLTPRMKYKMVRLEN